MTRLSDDVEIPLSIEVRDIKSYSFTSRRASLRLCVYDSNGEGIDFGIAHPDEIGFARSHLDRIHASRTASSIPTVTIPTIAAKNRLGGSIAEPLEGSAKLSTFGPNLTPEQWAALQKSSRPGEQPLFVLNAGGRGQLAAFTDRLVIVKQGLLAQLTGGNGVFEASYQQIRDIHLWPGIMSGYLEVQTSGIAPIRSGSAAFSKPNCLPLGSLQQKELRGALNALKRMAQSADPPRPSETRNLAPRSTERHRRTETVREVGVRQSKTQRGESTLQRLWIRALTDHNSVRSEYAAYTADPTQFFFRPLLSDLGHPAVEAFHDAFAAAETLRIDDHVPDDMTLVREFADRVTAAKRAWRTADALARKSGDSPFTTEQQQLLRRAQKSINLALDDHTSANERAAAYSRVLELFDKTRIDPPDSIAIALRGQIDRAVRQALPPGST
ncbi:hypothetical protein AAFP30_05130 [Gordonia sp. CPCC 205515]